MFLTPADAETAFYTAIEDKDINAMIDVWLDSEHVICIHPMGARLQGSLEVMNSWRHIFGNESSLRFNLRDIDQQISGKLAVHILHERIQPVSDPDKLAIIVTTNAYRFTGSGWKMILHHASISPDTVEQRKEPEFESEAKTLH